ncbi:hypothetical protein NL676_029493 [Syzygium grande]|nr:hypothetical protein NL676_029493 [Syzygium grande]
MVRGDSKAGRERGAALTSDAKAAGGGRRPRWAVQLGSRVEREIEKKQYSSPPPTFTLRPIVSGDDDSRFGLGFRHRRLMRRRRTGGSGHRSMIG